MSRIQNLVVLAGFTLLSTSSAIAESDRPLNHSAYDPQAEVVEFFTGISDGSIDAKLVAQGSSGGKLFLKNQTSQPLTVKMPPGFVGIPVHAQFAQPGAAANPFSQLTGNNNGNNNAPVSGPQAIGAGTSNSSSTNNNNGLTFGNNTNNGNPFPQGFFSIPAQRTLRVSYTSVCLNHGLQDPGPRTPYRLIPVQEYTSDPVLQVLINHVGSHQDSQRTLQAAVWNVANEMSWSELATKGNGPIQVPGDRFFTSSQLKEAHQLVSDLNANLPQEVTPNDSSLAEESGQRIRIR